MPIINRTRTRVSNGRRLNSAIRYLDLVDAVKFRNINISDSARTAAKTKIDNRIQEKQAEFQRRRSATTRRRLRTRPVLFKQAKQTVSALVAEHSPTNAKRILETWATRPKTPVP